MEVQGLKGRISKANQTSLKYFKVTRWSWRFKGSKDATLKPTIPASVLRGNFEEFKGSEDAPLRTTHHQVPRFA